MFARIFSTLRISVNKLPTKTAVKPAASEAALDSKKWMANEIKKADSFTKLDATEMDAAMKDAEKLEKRSSYYR